MDKEQKRLKPGQLVTVDNRVYRITKCSLVFPCELCDCTICLKIMIVKLCFRTPHDCYLKLVK